MFNYIIVVFVLSWAMQILSITKKKKVEIEGVERISIPQKFLFITMLIPTAVLVAFIAFGQIPLDWEAFGMYLPPFYWLIIGAAIPVFYTTVIWVVLRNFAELDKDFIIYEDGKWELKRMGTLLRKVLQNSSIQPK